MVEWVSEEPGRGAEAVQEALIAAAAARLSEAGPSGVSVRDVARRAGVNHGQVHHYFGGKRGLLVAAMRKLARDHFDTISRRSAGSPIPPLFSLAEDPDYWRAICLATMEGDLELARIEVDEGISIPRRALDALRERDGMASDVLEFKARFAMVAALQLGWVALEDFIMLISDVADEDRAEVRERARQLLATWMDRALLEAKPDPGTPERRPREDGSAT
jgi:AcrR family transcriptional regulator